MLLDILIVVSILYAVQILVFALAGLNARYRSDRSLRPTVTIIVPARNEEESIRRCLDSMLHLTYPRHLLEIVVVDDRSTDNTSSIIQSIAQTNSHIKVVVAEPGAGNLWGKTNAVTQGIEHSSGEIILFTDADCVVPPSWVEETVKYYTGEDIGIVAGFTSLRSNGLFQDMQALDWFVLFTVAAATTRLHLPVTAVGNNLSVRRKAYEATGGYRKIPFSVTEDYALFHATTSTTGYKPRFPLDRNTLVESSACKSWNELYHQKKRWFTGGRDMEPKSILLFGLSYILNALFLVAGVVLGPQALLVPLALKISVDLILTLPALGAFKRWRLLLSFPLYELYYFFYVIIYPPLVLIKGEIVWKDRAL